MKVGNRIIATLLYLSVGCSTTTLSNTTSLEKHRYQCLFQGNLVTLRVTTDTELTVVEKDVFVDFLADRLHGASGSDEILCSCSFSNDSKGSSEQSVTIINNK